MIIYHITPTADWNKALMNGFYEAASLHTEGFIHCSTEAQVQGVLDRYFQGHEQILKLVIETDKLTSPLKFELAPSVNEEFPHIYGPLNLEAVIGVMPAREEA